MCSRVNCIGSSSWRELKAVILNRLLASVRLLGTYKRSLVHMIYSQGMPLAIFTMTHR